MVNLSKELENAKTIGISGHIRPDGDCIGSVMGLFLYIKNSKPDATVRAFLEEPADIFDCIKEVEEIENAENVDEEFDIFFCLDCDKTRLGAAEHLFDAAKTTINIDHHVSNPGCGDYNYIVPKASSTSELIYDLLDKKYIDKDIAMALYIGIIHDTGVMQYSNTSPKTLRIVADLVEYGFDFPRLIDETFYEKSLLQTQISAKVMADCKLFLDGKVAFGKVDYETMQSMGLKSYDLDGIVNQLRLIKGVEASVFMYGLENGDNKVSLRSRSYVDVAKICQNFKGGGHVRAAGCTVSMDAESALKEILKLIEEQI
jgi:phosphoesterase RecJ-like protein